MKPRFGLILLIIGILGIPCIVYFVFTATQSSPASMALYMPKESDSDTVDRYSGVKTKLTLILLKDDTVFGYYGDSLKGGRSVSVVETGNLIADGWKMFSRDSLVVVIKPTEQASYKATVDILDQMNLNHIEKYSMTDLNQQEKEILKIAE